MPVYRFKDMLPPYMEQLLGIEGYRSTDYNSARKDDSPLVRFGASTWTYEGWQGQIYRKKYAKITFPGRLLTSLKMSYEAAEKRAEPYNKIVGELPEMRQETVVLIKQAIEENRRAYVLVNTRSEGNAPMTIQALMKALLG